ncbi:MAG: CBS domain-containing protein [Ottowia sp.]
MKVSDILRVKTGTALYTVQADETLATALESMAEKDIGSLVVLDHGELVGMLTFREVIQALARLKGHLGDTRVRSVMDDAPITCTPETELKEVSRMMLKRHARYMPVMDQRMLMGVISFYDMAQALVDSQNFENKLLKAFIRNWQTADDDPDADSARQQPDGAGRA